MRTLRRGAALIGPYLAALAIGCAPAGEKTNDTATGTTATPTGGAPTISLADVAGTWNMVAVPASGADTTATVYTMVATANTSGWVTNLPNRPPVPLNIHVEGDSIITDSAPFESVRRPGVQVTSRTVVRLQEGRLLGTIVARYATTGPDSVVVLRLTGTKAPR